MRHVTSVFLMHGALACAVVIGVAAANALDDKLPQVVGFELVDLAGQKHVLGGQPDSKLTVLVFLGTECPVSNGYAPTLKRLYMDHTTAGVRFLGVHCDPDVSAQIAQTHAREYELNFPLVLDHDQRLAQACGVKTVPTAVVVSADGRLLYRGRIDNRFVATGSRRPEATVFDLKVALESALAGRQPAPSTTEPVGCPLPPVPR
jgi:peroxiredoxin